eukprot:SAG11_NODE_1248_length_5396_cov_2.091372_2_plen_124_part_00
MCVGSCRVGISSGALPLGSSVSGLQKPDPAIYRLALEALGGAGPAGSQLRPVEVAFLDDIGLNLKPARAMGLATVKVENESEWQYLEALAKLEELTGVRLLEPADRALHVWPPVAAAGGGSRL